MNALKILRLGGVNPTTSRFLDLLSLPEIEQLDLLLNENEKDYINELYEVARYFDVQHLLSKIRINVLNIGAVRRVLMKGARILDSNYLYQVAYSHLRKYKKKDFDFIWVGDNDFDGSNLLFVAVRKIFGDSLIVRSYKETRFSKKREELYMLKNADRLILPNKEYKKFFDDLYGIDLVNFSVADLDWRYSRTIDWVRDLKVEKLSKSDGIPHVCILTGRALCDPGEKRSGYRYFFVPVIEELVKRGIHVHLHALRIVESTSGIKNPYKEISERTGLLSIEGPLRLVGGSQDYEILKRYDAGILHPPVPEENEDLKRFQEINVPNRLFEYQIARVMPISEKHSTPAVDRIISETEFGIVFDSYDELADRLKKSLSSRKVFQSDSVGIKTFRDFSEVLINSAS